MLTLQTLFPSLKHASTFWQAKSAVWSRTQVFPNFSLWANIYSAFLLRCTWKHIWCVFAATGRCEQRWSPMAHRNKLQYIRLWLHRQCLLAGLIPCWLGLFMGFSFVDNKKIRISAALFFNARENWKIKRGLRNKQRRKTSREVTFWKSFYSWKRKRDSVDPKQQTIL